MTEQTAVSAPDTMLNTYMRDVSKHSLLTPAQERELGARLIERRTDYWLQVLSYAPYAAAAVDLVCEVLEIPHEMQGDLDRVRSAARAARDSNRRAAGTEFRASIEAVSRKLGNLDPECVGADHIAADLELLDARNVEGVSMKVRPPRRHSQPFDDYVGRVRRANAALRVVRNRFAEANLRLVVRIAHRFQRSGLTLHDRVQEGNLGLMKAVDRFDPARGFRFSTYASWWIKHAIRRAVVNRGRIVRLPAHLQAAGGKLAQARGKLQLELSHEPSTEELAAELEMSVEKVELVASAMGQRALSLDARLSDSEDRSVADVLADEDAPLPDELIAATWDARSIRAQLRELSPMEQDILTQRFGLDGGDESTLTEIGGQYSLSRERIRQLQQRALHRIRDGLQGPRARDFASTQP